MLIDTSCPICRSPGRSPCAECAELFVPHGPVEPTPRGLDAVFAATAYAEAARPLITALKYRNQRGATGWLADAMVAVLPEDMVAVLPEDMVAVLPEDTVAVLPPAHRTVVVTWAPTTPARRRERGFDQAELLARAVARRIKLRPRRLLVRRAGQTQTGRGGAERRHDSPVFALASRSVPRSILLIDDVVTTGSTLAAAAAALRRGGADVVVGLVAAATPRPQD